MGWMRLILLFRFIRFYGVMLSVFIVSEIIEYSIFFHWLLIGQNAKGDTFFAILFSTVFAPGLTRLIRVLSSSNMSCNTRHWQHSINRSLESIPLTFFNHISTKNSLGKQRKFSLWPLCKSLRLVVKFYFLILHSCISVFHRHISS